MAVKGRGYRHNSRQKERRKEQEVRLGYPPKSPGQGSRRHDQKSTVSDLVYNYLSKISYSDSVRKLRNNACNKFRRRNARKRTIHPLRKYTNADRDEARCYVRKALSFAVNTGYLIPTDRTGRNLRLSPNLRLSSLEKDE